MPGNSTPTTMRAARIHRNGGSDVVQIETIPTPVPGAGSVLVRVVAAGINPIDWKLREGMFPLSLPSVLGQDLAGHVEAIGDGVDQFAVGQPVYAMLPSHSIGAYAEYAIVPSSALSRVPTNLELVVCAAVPMGALTAWKALFDVADLRPGERILVHGAGGTVGGMAVQLAMHHYSWVAATASGSDVQRSLTRGINLSIDHSAIRFEEAIIEAGGVDVVLDVIGGETLERSWRCLREGGRIVSTLGPTVPPPKFAARRLRGLPGFQTTPDGERLLQIADLIEHEILEVPWPKVSRLDQAAEAMDLAQQGHGKVVLEVEGHP